MKTISLYTGAGGLDLGLEAAGFGTAVAVEMDHEAVATLQANRDWPVVDDDIHSASATTGKLMDRAGVHKGEATLLAGGPPCQPFSKSGYWHSGDAKRLDDPRARTLGAYFRVLRESLPEVYLLENVPGLAFSEKDEGLALIRRELNQINRECGTNYTFAARQLNSAEFGVPQLRQRVFVVGHRDGLTFEFPEPTHAFPPPVDMANGGGAHFELGDLNGLQAPLTAWDAIGHLQDDDDPALAPRGKWAGLLPTIPEGYNYLFHTDRGHGLSIFGWRRRYWSMLLKLAKNRPSWTLTAQPGPAIGPFHWKSRRLSAAELCALQTFPKDYRIVGDVRSAHKQVGNAVPSALVEIIGLTIRRQLLQQADADPSKPTLLPRRQGAPPPPEKPLPVEDERYLSLVGEHAEHPGTGKGPGASRRAQVASR